MYKYFIYTNLFHLQCSKAGSSKFLQNVGIHVSSYMAPHSVRVQSIAHEISSQLHIKKLSESLVFGGEKVLLVLTLILRMWKKW
jgi:hypothetical protein